MYYVYVLYSDLIDKYYVGHTNNIDRRITEQNLRSGRYTSHKGTWRLVYKEEVATRSEAMKREKFLKTGKGRDYFKSKIESANKESNEKIHSIL